MAGRNEWYLFIQGFIPNHQFNVGDGIPHDIESSTFLVKEILKILSDRYQNHALNYLAEKLLTHTYFMNSKQMKDISYVAGCLFSSYDNYTCPESPPSIERKIPSATHSLTKCKIPEYFPEVVVFHHGLKHSKRQIKEYIKNRDMIDAGAYIGDSACILSSYTNKKIYSYEISKSNYNALKAVVKNNNIDDKVVTFRKGLASKEGVMHLIDTGNSGASIVKEGNENISLVTIDDEARKYNMKIGFMKADCEGFDLEVLKGAADVIRRDRPVISFQTYHNFEEFFGIPEFIMSFPNYMFYFRVEGINKNALGEYGIFAYPAEIIYPTYTPSQMDEIRNFPGINISTWNAF